MDSDQNRPHDSAARIRGFDLSVEVLLQSFQDSFPKGSLMGAPIGRVLPVDEGENRTHRKSRWWVRVNSMESLTS